MSITEIRKMPIRERLEVMEQIWDSLRDEGHELPSPEWHGSVLSGRRERIESGKATFMTFDELKSTFRR